MRAIITSITTLIVCIALTGCDRRFVLEERAGLDNEVFRENDIVPEVGTAPSARRGPAGVGLNAPGPVGIPVASSPPGIITAASGSVNDIDLRYNAATEITIRDVVLGKKYVQLDEHHTGVIVELQPGGDFIDVLVGTTKYLFQADVDLHVSDPLMVTGSRIIVNGRPMLLAKTLFLRNREIPLRDEDNYPLWRDSDQKAPREVD